MRFGFANRYKVEASARGPLQSYPNESNAEETQREKKEKKRK